MTVAEERAAYFAKLSGIAIDSASKLMRASWATCENWKGGVAPNMENRLGLDVDSTTLVDIEKLHAGTLGRVTAWREAQLRELAFWRWVAHEGYQHIVPELLPLHQEHLMVSTYYRTGWSRNRFVQKSIFELGCGPLGMVEYVPGRTRVAFDPLNTQYARLFAKCRSSEIKYYSTEEEIAGLSSSFDLAICHNVIDHTEDPALSFDSLFDKLQLGGEFIFQVNLSRIDVVQSLDHKKMHPSPLTREQILQWLKLKSDSYEFFEAKTPSELGEFYFLAWGKKTQSLPVTYANMVLN